MADRLRGDYGAIDILVNDIWGAEVLKGPPSTWNKPMWELDLDAGLRTVRLGVETHLITSHCLLPLLVARPGGLLVEVTDGTAEFNAQNYRISVYYDLAKVAVNRIAFSQGHDLAPFGATAVAVTPGWLRSEMMLDNYAVTEANWQTAMEARPDGFPTAPGAFTQSETPALRRPWGGRHRGGPGPGPLESALGEFGAARPRVRLHRRRRTSARRMGRVVDIFQNVFTISLTPPSAPCSMA